MYLTATNILLSISFLTTAVLSTILLLKNRNQSSVFLSLSAYGATFWILAEIIFINTSNVLIFTVAAKTLHIAGLIILAAFVCFAYAFLGPNIKKNKKLLFGMSIFFILFLILLVFTEKVIKGARVLNGEKIITFGPLYFWYAVYILTTAFLSYYYLIKKSRSAKNKIEKLQLLYIGMGTIISLSVGLIFNIVLPFFGHFAFYWLGPFLTVVFVIFATYAIFKHHLFNIKVISVELFSALVSIFVLIDALLAKTLGEFILKFGLFAAVSFFSYLLIRSVIAEIRAREKIQKLAKQLETANRELKVLDKEKSDFLSIASHQLRTPMTIIKGYISMMNEGLFGEISQKAKEAMSKVYVSNERLIKLINDLLDLSRIERGKMKYNFQKHDLEKIVEDMIKEYKPVAENKNLKLYYEKINPIIPEVELDEDYIRQVISNLIDNAIKYTEQGEIKITLSSEMEKIKLGVRDTGRGISEQEKTKLFQRYQRGLEEGAKGLGMGLYIAKKIVEDHKGKIWAESGGRNKGSTFFVELPTDTKVQ